MEFPTDRRTFLKLVSALGVSFSSNAVLAGSSPKEVVPRQPGKIDVHHHIVPPVYTSALAKIGITQTNGAPFPRWNSQQSMDVMERNDISQAITSISSPGIYFGDTEFTKDLARRCNEFSANLVAGNPQRFGGFAVLPLPDVDASLKELEYTLDELHLDGVVILTNSGGHYLGTPDWSELYSELNARKAVVYVHPTLPAGQKFPKMPVPPSFFEFIFDTTRAIANLIASNTLQTFPDIRFIIAHAGGAAPYLTWKMMLVARYATGSDSQTMHNIKSLYYDTALSTSTYTLSLLQELVGADHIVFGSDYPFAPEVVTATGIYELQNYDGFTKEQLQAVYRENAIALMQNNIH